MAYALSAPQWRLGGKEIALKELTLCIGSCRTMNSPGAFASALLLSGALVVCRMLQPKADR